MKWKLDSTNVFIDLNMIYNHHTYDNTVSYNLSFIGVLMPDYFFPQ